MHSPPAHHGPLALVLVFLSTVPVARIGTAIALTSFSKTNSMVGAQQGFPEMEDEWEGGREKGPVWCLVPWVGVWSRGGRATVGWMLTGGSELQSKHQHKKGFASDNG